MRVSKGVVAAMKHKRMKTVKAWAVTRNGNVMLADGNGNELAVYEYRREAIHNKLTQGDDEDVVSKIEIRVVRRKVRR